MHPLVRYATKTWLNISSWPCMPRFYLHLRDGDRVLEDPDGSDLLDVEAAQKEAIESARYILPEKLANWSMARNSISLMRAVNSRACIVQERLQGRAFSNRYLN